MDKRELKHLRKHVIALITTTNLHNDAYEILSIFIFPMLIRLVVACS